MEKNTHCDRMKWVDIKGRAITALLKQSVTL